MTDDEVRDSTDDGIQHGIDDNPEGDAIKGGVLGAVGGAAVGALAGGPVGAVIGAVAGGVVSAGAVAAVDMVDNDNNVTGLGDEVATEDDEDVEALEVDEVSYTDTGAYRAAGTADTGVGLGTPTAMGPAAGVGSMAGMGTAGTMGSGAGAVTGGRMDTDVGTTAGGLTPGNDIPGIQTGGRAVDGTPDTRGITEKAADAVTGDRYDDKTGKRVD
jgi:hypothetical protein